MLAILGWKKKKPKTLPKTLEEEYYEIMDKCAEHGTDFEIENRSLKHAEYALKIFFVHANNTVCIFTDKVNKAIFNKKDLIKEVLKFLRKGNAKLRIVCSDYNLNEENVLYGNGKFLTEILNDVAIKGKVEIWYGREFYSIKNYFILNDQLEFRYELPSELGQKRAVINFGNKVIGKKLLFIFDTMIANSKKVF